VNSYKKPIVDTFYDSPVKKMTRTCSFGIGNRELFGKLRNSPSPDRYDIKSSFEINKEKGKGIKLMPRLPTLVNVI
jgi:hypothetical protein